MVFKNEGILQILAGGTWRLVAPLHYQHPSFGDIIVPAGFTTDLASIPRFFHRIVNPCTTGTRRPAIVHDYIYSGATPFSRQQADRIFYDALRECGVNYLLANAMYYALRIGGRWAWRGIK